MSASCYGKYTKRCMRWGNLDLRVEREKEREGNEGEGKYVDTEKQFYVKN